MPDFKMRQLFCHVFFICKLPMTLVSRNANILVFRFLLIRVSRDDNFTSLEPSWNLKVLNMDHGLIGSAMVFVFF